MSYRVTLTNKFAKSTAVINRNFDLLRVLITVFVTAAVNAY